MPEVSLKVLRRLRDRASALLRTVREDLAPFKKDNGTFRRKPDSQSPPWDTNVTTTCSCLMALALTDQFRRFYSKNKQDGDTTKPAEQAAQIFETLLDAPWMSSGLADNNAFTTSLVLRAYGFLEQERIFEVEEAAQSTWTVNERAREWELHLGIRNALGLANKLKKHADAASEFLWLSLSDDSRNFIAAGGATPANQQRLKVMLGADLGRLVQSGWIYEPKRFKKVSKTTKARLRALKGAPTSYNLTRINHRLLTEQFPSELSKPKICSLKQIADTIASDPNNFSINHYPPSPAVVYWFLDGITRAGIDLSSSRWERLCRWAAQEFNHRRSLVVAEHDAMMDPVAMGMCACLCSRLRDIAEHPRLGAKKEYLTVLPSRVELEYSIRELVSHQTRNGIWHKYFPLFHYQDAGSNFCFTFELLEAVLCEFGKKSASGSDKVGTEVGSILGDATFLDALEKSVTWCEKNRLSCSEGADEYKGWNSGGQIETLEKGQPESWATAVVHMFLSELTTVLSERIQEEVLKKYKARLPKIRDISNSENESTNKLLALNDLLDMDVWLRGQVKPLLSVVHEHIIDPHSSDTEASLRREKSKAPLSALLFGPPGTSKTEITKAVADDLQWPLLEITPSDFVKGTLANVYLQADEIFDDLMDLAGVVVFFDEMDALVQTREGEIRLDIASQFLTTAMLPKLTRLHEQARSTFFMATNFQDRFDAAIKRAGRFDLLLCMGPPTLGEKINRLHRVYSLDSATKKTKKAGQIITKYLKHKPELRDQLALLTFGEYKAFLGRMGDADTIAAALEECGESVFQEELRTYSQYVTLKLSDLDGLRSSIEWKDFADLRAKFKFTLKELESKDVPITHIIRYLCDWKESKEQY